MSNEHVKLREKLLKNFSIADIKVLCFDIDVDFEALAHNTLPELVIDLITYCRKRGLLDDLINACQKARPNVAWGDIQTILSSSTTNGVSTNTDSYLQMESVWRELVAFNWERVDDLKLEAADVKVLEAHLESVVRAYTEGRIVILLGPDINLCGRPSNMTWKPGAFLPSSSDLASYLASRFGYTGDNPTDLVRVSQYVSVLVSVGEIYVELRKLFDQVSPPTPLHLLIAAAPGMLRTKGYHACYPLLVTSNYDDALERAFQQFNEPYDMVSYVAEGSLKGKFLHKPVNDKTRLISYPNKYQSFPLDKKGDMQRSIIVKIRGAVLQDEPDWANCVITEDHYIDFLSLNEQATAIPAQLKEKLMHSHLLFLGYNLRDWNLRAILHRVWGGRKPDTWKWWAVQYAPQQIDQHFGRMRDIELLSVPLEIYVAKLADRLLQMSSK